MTKKTLVISLVLAFTFTSQLFAQTEGVSINTDNSAPDPSAILDVSSSNKGVLIPRVALMSATQPISVEKAEGLLVYNDDPTNFPKGFYYWTGSYWNQFTTNGEMDFTLTGNTLSVNGNNVDLSKYIDNTEITNVGSGKVITDEERTKLNSVKDYALVTMQNDQTTGITIDAPVKFDKINGNLSLNGVGRVTLKANKTYKLSSNSHFIFNLQYNRYLKKKFSQR